MAAIPFNDKVMLIQEVQSHPVLWNGEHAKYGDRFYTAAAWNNISRKMNIPENILRRKWKNLRDTFRNIQKKSAISDLKKYNGKWRYFRLMTFIADEHREDDDSVEFIVESESDEERSDRESRVSCPTHGKNDDSESDFSKHDTSHDDESSNGKCENEKNQGITKDNGNKRQNYDTKDEKLEENNSNSEDEIPVKRQKTSNRLSNYDVMFLKSLAPYFKQLEPLRKLVMRSRIQNLLLNEIAEQNSEHKSDS
ncbi:uncharacterized protein LOC114351006 [Ostrinia furnacalis]|uniref:uncharacterized protein LOC114351006 n=1 Tax=Ostrinia furnacalis TaxID=93504 RepID=UPI00103F8EBE|nr:uncharacterized protein LOC114351006 [Ostrinia furnacalis]